MSLVSGISNQFFKNSWKRALLKHGLLPDDDGRHTKTGKKERKKEEEEEEIEEEEIEEEERDEDVQEE